MGNSGKFFLVLFIFLLGMLALAGIIVFVNEKNPNLLHTLLKTNNTIEHTTIINNVTIVNQTTVIDTGIAKAKEYASSLFWWKFAFWVVALIAVVAGLFILISKLRPGNNMWSLEKCKKYARKLGEETHLDLKNLIWWETTFDDGEKDFRRYTISFSLRPIDHNYNYNNLHESEVVFITMLARDPENEQSAFFFKNVNDFEKWLNQISKRSVSESMSPVKYKTPVEDFLAGEAEDQAQREVGSAVGKKMSGEKQ
jgi:hypothetical protein